MARYEVTLTVVVEATDEDDAFFKALSRQYDDRQTIVEEDGIRRLPDPIEVNR
jgi:hypothetical protein